MKKNMLPLLAIAFVVAIISTGLFYGLFASKLSGSSVDLPKQSVVVSARKPPRGAVLTAADVHVAKVRGRTAFGNSFSRPEQVIGSTVLDPWMRARSYPSRRYRRRIRPKAATCRPVCAPSLSMCLSRAACFRAQAGSRVDIQAISDREKHPCRSTPYWKTSRYYRPIAT